MEKQGGAVIPDSLSVRRPSIEAVASFLARSASSPLSYGSPGLTRRHDDLEAMAASAGYVVDRYTVVLGSGVEDFERARTALLSWRPFEIGWVELHGSSRVASQETVAVLVRLPGVWSLNACRVVYVEERAEKGRGAESAFAYGTLPGHAEAGEERFSVRWDPASDEVSYSIVAVSKPALWITRLGAPIARRVQRRFGRASLAAMRCAVAG